METSTHGILTRITSQCRIFETFHIESASWHFLTSLDHTGLKIPCFHLFSCIDMGLCPYFSGFFLYSQLMIVKYGFSDHVEKTFRTPILSGNFTLNNVALRDRFHIPNVMREIDLLFVIFILIQLVFIQSISSNPNLT